MGALSSLGSIYCRCARKLDHDRHLPDHRLPTPWAAVPSTSSFRSSGKLIAISGPAGLQFFHFDGSAYYALHTRPCEHRVVRILSSSLG